MTKKTVLMKRLGVFETKCRISQRVTWYWPKMHVTI